MAWSIRSSKTIIALALLFALPAQARSLRAYLDNSAGLRHFKEKLFFQSYRDFLKAIEQDPLNPDLQNNLGITFMVSEEWAKAEKAFMSAYDLAKGDKEREFMALFNIAIARAQGGNIDGALQAYQRALEIDPDSLEVKTNIELLWQSQQGQGKGGQGKGDGQDDKQEENQDQNKNQDKQYQNQKQQPKPFQSKDLSKEDVRKILGEIQNQEQSIRAKEYEKGAKERGNDKDW